MEGGSSRACRMIISHQNRFIFLKPQKCAGTSLELALSQVCGPDDVITSLGPDERLRQGRGPQNDVIPERYRAFGWQLRERLGMKTSRRGTHFYSHMPAHKVRRSMDPALFDAYRKIIVARNPWDRVVSLYFWHYRDREPRPSFESFVRIPRSRPERKTFELYSIDGRLVADVVLRYESLQPDLAAFLRSIGVNGPPALPSAKGQHRPQQQRDYRQFYNAATQRIVARRYAREIEAFAYQF